MRKGNPIRLLLQALTLAAVSLAMSVGSALAHGGSVANLDQLQAQAAAAHVEHQQAANAAPHVEVVQIHAGDAIGGPCSGQPAEHAPGASCCTIACHAALTAPAADPLGAFDLPGTRMVDWPDMLEGRSSDRTERPPKLG